MIEREEPVFDVWRDLSRRSSGTRRAHVAGGIEGQPSCVAQHKYKAGRPEGEAFEVRGFGLGPIRTAWLVVTVCTAVAAIIVSRSPGPPPATPMNWRPTVPPPHGDVAGAEWIEVDVSMPSGQDRQILAAVFRPDGEGPFPVIVYLHGSSGLGPAMLRWAPRLSKAGFLVIAGCYVLTLPMANRIACPDGPSSEPGVAALIGVASQLPDGRRDGIGVLGLSVGARMAFSMLGDPNIRAVVTDSGDPGLVPLVDPATIDAPLLLLAFEHDSALNQPALRQYDERLRNLGKRVDSHYFEGSGHVVTMSEGTTYEATALTIAFFNRYLRETGGSAKVTSCQVEGARRAAPTGRDERASGHNRAALTFNVWSESRRRAQAHQEDGRVPRFS